jgi:hypothetical protein
VVLVVVRGAVFAGVVLFVVLPGAVSAGVVLFVVLPGAVPGGVPPALAPPPPLLCEPEDPFDPLPELPGEDVGVVVAVVVVFVWPGAVAEVALPVE